MVAVDEAVEAQPDWVLPSISDCHLGPISTSNWLIPGALLAGAYPGARCDREHSETIAKVLGEGIDTFVCLIEKRQLKNFNPYKEKAMELAGARQLDFFWAEIEDFNIAEDKVARSAAETIIRAVKAGRVCYVHCWGGTGRTGTICSIVLGRLYGIAPEKAITHFQASHRKRTARKNAFPEAASQLQQALRLGRETQGSGEGAADDLPTLQISKGAADDLPTLHISKGSIEKMPQGSMEKKPHRALSKQSTPTQDGAIANLPTPARGS